MQIPTLLQLRNKDTDPIQTHLVWFPMACLFSNHPMYLVSPPFCLFLRFPNLPRLACILVLTCLAILAHRAFLIFLLICRFFAIHLSYVLSTHSFLSSNWDQSFWSYVISFSVARLFLIYIPLLHLLYSSSLLCDLSLLVSLFFATFLCISSGFSSLVRSFLMSPAKKPWTVPVWQWTPGDFVI